MSPRILLVISAVLAATGQICFKLGANGATTLADFINVKLAGALALYGVSTILWIVALSKLPLSKVYPFTALTFVIVYIGSATILNEQLTVSVVLGAALVLAGLIVLTVG